MGPGALAGARFRASQAAGAGVVLEPAQATGFGFAGSVVSFTQTVTNQTGVESDLTLSLAGNAWPAALAITQTGVLADGAAITFTVYVTVPAAAQPGDSDMLTVTARSTLSPTQVSTATLTTRVPRPGYVLSYAENRIRILDMLSHADTGLGIDTLPYGAGPEGDVLSPDGRWLYVTLYKSRAVLIVDTVAHTPVMTIPVGQWPTSIALTADYAFVANMGGNMLSVIDLDRRVVTVTIPLSDHPINLDVNVCLNKVYVTLPEANAIAVVDAGSLTVTQVITGLATPYGIQVSPYGDRAYVTVVGSDYLQVRYGPGSRRGCLVHRHHSPVQNGPHARRAHTVRGRRQPVRARLGDGLNRRAGHHHPRDQFFCQLGRGGFSVGRRSVGLCGCLERRWDRRHRYRGQPDRQDHPDAAAIAGHGALSAAGRVLCARLFASGDAAVETMPTRRWRMKSRAVRIISVALAAIVVCMALLLVESRAKIVRRLIDHVRGSDLT